MTALPWVRDDGGRAGAGFRGVTEDCVCRAIAIVTSQPYREVYDWLNELARLGPHRAGRNGRAVPQSSARTGIAKPITRYAMTELGWTWTPTMFIGSGCRVHLAIGELPSGRLITQLSGHVAAVIDGVVLDSYDPCRGGTRCVYGYWHLP